MKAVKFNKFFPEDNAFVTVDGRMDADDDWQVSLTIQADTKNVANWWCSDWNYKEATTQLKAYQEAMQKAKGDPKCVNPIPSSKTVTGGTTDLVSSPVRV